MSFGVGARVILVRPDSISRAHGHEVGRLGTVLNVVTYSADSPAAYVVRLDGVVSTKFMLESELDLWEDS